MRSSTGALSFERQESAPNRHPLTGENAPWVRGSKITSELMAILGRPSSFAHRRIVRQLFHLPKGCMPDLVRSTSTRFTSCRWLAPGRTTSWTR